MKYAYHIVAIFLFCGMLEEGQPANILGLIPYSGKSHYIYQRAIFEELAIRGHNVTVVTTYEEKNPVNENYRQVVVDKKSIWDYADEHPSGNYLGQVSFVRFMQFVWGAGVYMTNGTLNSPALKEMMADKNRKFDLVISETFYQEALYAFAYKYDAPLILLTTLPYLSETDLAVGNPIPISHIPHIFHNLDFTGNIFERTILVFYYFFDLIGRIYYAYPMHEKLIQKHFHTNSSKPYPCIVELEDRTALVLRNSHFTWNRIYPILPNIIEIGGAHLERLQRKSMTEDIKKFIDDSPHGVIYFSMGSNVKQSDLGPVLVEDFFKVLGGLQERVIWKFEDVKRHVPKNILIRDWLPQFEILAHPKTKLFMSQAGIHSIHEAIHFAVPTIGIPIFGDQHHNARKLEETGMGLSMPLETINEKVLNDTIWKVLTNPSYKNNALSFSTLFKERPMSALNTAMYWIEYVIKNKHSPLLKPTLRSLTWFSYYALDVFALITAGIIIIFSIIFICLRKISYLFLVTDSKIKKH